jgi:hypothetical protein
VIQCIHGFESCATYKNRIMYIDQDTPVGWSEGDPEDEIIEEIDELELRLKDIGGLPCFDYCAYMAVTVMRDNGVDLLRSKLLARSKKSGKMISL